MSPFVVEVNEGKVDATGRGAHWWAMFSQRFHDTGRIRQTVAPAIVGGVVEVACDSRDDAEWLAGHMIGHGGLPPSAVRVKVASPPGACPVTGA